MMIDPKNQKFAATILFSDPETGEELRPIGPPETGPDGEMILKVESGDFSRRWKHTISTEQI